MDFIKGCILRAVLFILNLEDIQKGMGARKVNARAYRHELVEVAQGKRPADMLIKGGTVINVYSGEFLQQNIALYKDCIAYVGENEVKINENTNVIDANGMYVSPGFIETHASWVIYNPISITAKVLPLGTTTTVNDNLFFICTLVTRALKSF